MQLAAWVDIATVVGTSKRYAACASQAAGIVKALNGLGASVFSIIHMAFFDHNVHAYPLFIGVYSFIVAWTTAYFLPPDNVQAYEQANLPAKHRYMYYVSICIMLVFVLAVSTIAAYDSGKNDGAVYIWPGVVLLLLLACFAFVPWISAPLEEGWLRDERGRVKHKVSDADDVCDESEYANKSDEREFPPPKVRSSRSIAPLREMTLAQCLSSADYYLLFTSVALGEGTALMLCNNIAQLDKSLRFVQKDDGEVAGQEAIFLSLLVSEVLLRACVLVP